MSWEKQNQLISSINEHMSKKIQFEVLSARLFSISIDSTFGPYRKEKVSFIIRHTNDKTDALFECLIAVQELDQTTEEALFKKFEMVMQREYLD